MKNIFIALFLVLSLRAIGQEPTTFILVRHAEKVVDGSQNPALTAAGEARAAQFAALFSKTEVSAVFSTNYLRTKETVAPLVQMNGLAITTYSWDNPSGFLTQLIEEFAGGTVVISGHSNTTPVLANLLLGTEQFKQFDESDYSNILIITTPKLGHGTLTHLTY